MKAALRDLVIEGKMKWKADIKPMPAFKTLPSLASSLFMSGPARLQS
jgi:hypothetical protein